MSALLTPREAAGRLHVSTEQLTGFANDGEIRYVNVGRGHNRPRRMYTEEDLEEFIERRKRKDAFQCQSTSRKGRPTTPMTSKSEVIGFMARRSARIDAKRKP